MVYLKSQHFLQAKAWALFQDSLGKTSIIKSGKGWSYTAYLETGFGKVGKLFSRLYVPYGPTYTSEANLNSALKDLDAEAKKASVDYIRIEPICIMGDVQIPKHINGYNRLQHSFQPDLTLIIDLDRDFSDVIADMSKTNRYLWKKSASNGLKFNISYSQEDMSIFLDMMRATSERTGTKFAKADYYQKLFSSLVKTKNVGLAFASYQEKPLVSALFVDDLESKTRYYMYAGSFDEARKYSANAPLVVFLMEDAKNNGQKYFDLFGVSPKDAKNHKWAGFSKFKRLFGGQELAYSGTWEKPIKPTRYKAMNFARKFASN